MVEPDDLELDREETAARAAVRHPEQPEKAVEEAESEEEPTFFDTRRIIQTTVIVLVLIAAIYILFPKIVGLQGSLSKLSDADPVWIVVSLAFDVLAFASYVALFRGVVGENVVHLEWGESYQITMAGLAATRLFSAGGAGGILLTYWALREAGLGRRQSGCRAGGLPVVLSSVCLPALGIFW